MASTLSLLAVTLLLFSFATAVISVEDDELESMLNVLRGRGYNLFSNAICTSDLNYEVLAGKSFTFFAPPDSSLFTLDMTNTANEYISTLRCHVIPLRMTFLELRLLPPGSSLPTLAENHRASVRLETSPDESITIDGVRIVLPDLYYSRNIAVHGLRGNLNCTTPVQDLEPGNRYSSPPRHGKSSSRSRARNHSHNTPPTLNHTSSNTSATAPNIPGAHLPSPASLSDHNEYPSSPASEPPLGGGFYPLRSPEQANLPPQVSPAYDLWLDAPTSTVFSPNTEPGPPPEFSENDDPMAFPPSPSPKKLGTGTDLSSMNQNKLPVIEDELKNEFSDLIPGITLDEMAGIKGKSWEKCELLDEADLHCAEIDGLHRGGAPDAYGRLNFGNSRM